jgi:hypothetical protein
VVRTAMRGRVGDREVSEIEKGVIENIYGKE